MNATPLQRSPVISLLFGPLLLTLSLSAQPTPIVFPDHFGPLHFTHRPGFSYGLVSHIQEYREWANGEPTTRGVRYTFNYDGNPAVITGPDGETWRYAYTSGTDGPRPLRITVTAADGVQEKEIVYAYKSSYDVVETFNADGSRDKVFHYYDRPKGTLKEKKTFTMAAGEPGRWTLQSRIIYHFGDRGLLRGEMHYYYNSGAARQTVQRKVLYSYVPGTDRLRERREYYDKVVPLGARFVQLSAFDKVAQTDTYEYDDQGRLVKRVQMVGDYREQQWTYTYGGGQRTEIHERFDLPWGSNEPTVEAVSWTTYDAYDKVTDYRYEEIHYKDANYRSVFKEE